MPKMCQLQVIMDNNGQNRSLKFHVVIEIDISGFLTDGQSKKHLGIFFITSKKQTKILKNPQKNPVKMK